MKSRKKSTKKRLSPKEIDEIVELQATDDSAWGRPIHVRVKKPAALSLPSKLAARAAFLARMHKEKNLEDWLARIIQERVELEESAFSEAKRAMSHRNSA